ncbi:MAG TPA: DUF2760 domain-containing protein [Polyangiaceae bacterium]
MDDSNLPFFSRLSFAFAAFFGILFDGAYAGRLFRARALNDASDSSGSAARASEPPPDPDDAEDLSGAAANRSAAADGSAPGPAERARAGREAREEEAEAKRANEHREESGALLLLGILQREGRLIDFLEQDIAGFSDADIGAAARAVHEGTRRALRSHLAVEPARTESEGARVTLEAGFDANAVKLTGNVRGSAPFTGTLKHPGWRAKDVHLPRAVDGHDVHVLAPAEVEL